MANGRLQLLLLLQLVSFVLLASDGSAINTDYLFHFDSPEDYLVEFQRPDMLGNTFPLGQESAFEANRRKWRAGSSKIHAPIVPVQDILDVVNEADNGPFATRIPLGSFVKFLWEHWPEIADDFPSAEKISGMGLDELLAGDWHWNDADDDGK